MKIEVKDGKIIVYLYQYRFSFKDKEILHKEIKTLFIKLIRKYNLELFGFNKVNIYENKIYGAILEIENVGIDNFYHEIIDLKINVYNDVSFFFEFDDDYNILNYHDIQMENNRYYLEIKNNDDIINYIEYGKIIYKK